jgi:hypothetical protein
MNDEFVYKISQNKWKCMLVNVTIEVFHWSAIIIIELCNMDVAFHNL